MRAQHIKSNSRTVGSNDKVGMVRHILILGFAGALLGGCATVDMADMTAMKTNSSLEQSETMNPVMEASETLSAKLEDKGLCQTRTERMKTAARVLLKGRKAAESSISNKYVSTKPVLSTIQADILEVTELVQSTTSAARTFVEIPEYGSDLRNELKSLEKALSSTELAQNSFQAALGQVGSTDNAALSGLQSATDALRTVTNTYGDQVRERTHRTDDPAS